MANRPHIKVIWATHKTITADWRFGLYGRYVRRGATNTAGIAISVRGVLIWLGVLAFLGYVAGATVLHSWLERRPFNQVTWVDCFLLPARYDEIKVKRGEAYIQEGLDDFKNKRWRDGAMKLRNGLNRSPHNVAARLELARFYVAANARKMARDTLKAGLGGEYPGRDYIEFTVRMAAQGEDYELWLEACDTALAALEGKPTVSAQKDRPWVLQQKIQCLLASGKADEAGKLADAAGPDGSSLISEFKVLAILQSGDTSGALAFLDAWQARGGALPQILRLRVRVLREAFRYDEMERVLDEMRSQTPADPRPYVYGIVQRAMAGLSESAARTLDSYLLRFGANAGNLMLAAEPLAQVGAADLVRRCLEEARAQGQRLIGFRRALVQAEVIRHDWKAAQDALSRMMNEPGNDEPGMANWSDLMARLVNAALNPAEGAQLALVGYVRDRQLPLALYREIIEQLTSANRMQTARDITVFAIGTYPQSGALVKAQRELDASLAAAQLAMPEARVAAVAQEMGEETAKKTAAILADATPTPLPAEFNYRVGAPQVIKRLRDLLTSGEPGTAINLIRTVRASKPQWLVERDGELLAIEAHAYAIQNDTVMVQSVISKLINGNKFRSAAAVGLAKTLKAEGRESAMRIVMDLFLRKDPEYAPAQRLREEWGLDDQLPTP